jgi:hypothetical protein
VHLETQIPCTWSQVSPLRQSVDVPHPHTPVVWASQTVPWALALHSVDAAQPQVFGDPLPVVQVMPFTFEAQSVLVLHCPQKPVVVSQIVLPPVMLAQSVFVLQPG